MSVELDYKSARLIVVMGTTGCGKSTVGAALAELLGASYFEGDDYHSPQNKSKMAAGTPLTDEDRWPWLQALSVAMGQNSHSKVVASCSSLKRAYRDFITKNANEPVLFVHLYGSKEVLASRLSERQNHFMNTGLLDSQLDTLEKPESDEFSLSIDIDASVSDIVDDIAQTIA